MHLRCRLGTSVISPSMSSLVLVDGGADDPWRMMPDGKLVRSSELVRSRPIPLVKTTGPLRMTEIAPAALQQMRAGLVEASLRANEPPRDKLPVDVAANADVGARPTRTCGGCREPGRA